MPSLSISAKTVPSGTPAPGTIQGWIDLIAQYLQVDGLGSFTGVNIGSVAPADPADRDKPWFRTDSVTGRTRGWWFWDGAAWAQVSPFLPRGATVPANPVEGEKFFQTNINAPVVNRSGWKLDDGQPSGSLKWVDYDPSIALGSSGDFAAGTYDTVLGLNPGYTQFSSATDRVLIAAGTKAVRTTGGAEEHTLIEDELPEITVTIPARTTSTAGTGSLPSGGGPIDDSVDADPFGGGQPHNNMQPYYVSWLLKKA